MKDLPKLLKDTFIFFFQNIYGIWNVIFPLIVPLSILGFVLPQYVPPENTLYWVPLGADVIFYPIIQGAVIFYISSVISGKAYSRTDCYHLALKFWLPMFGVYTIGSMAVVLGVILLVIPGFIVYARLMFSEFFCLLDEQDSVGAIKSSWEQTKDYQFQLLVGFVLIFIFIGMPLWILEKTVEPTSVLISIFMIALNIAKYLLGCLVTIFAYRIFWSHRDNLNNSD